MRHGQTTFALVRILALSGVCVAAACSVAPSTGSDTNNGDDGSRSHNPSGAKDAGATVADAGHNPGPGNGQDPGDAGKGPPAPPDGGKDYLFPDNIHTGFDGTNTYKVPVSTSLVGAGVTWGSDDPSIVSIVSVPVDPQAASFISGAMITTKKAGTTKVFATQGTKREEANVTVTAYTLDQFNLGKTRYTTGGDTGPRRACAGCHQTPAGADHSPSTLAWYDDTETLQAIQTGAYPDGYVLKQAGHQWQLTDPEKAGIMSYLRALPPKQSTPVECFQ
jgi:hypothetical protein